MPFTENGGVKIYWEEEGKGAPVLLIMGLGWPSYMWYRTKPLLTGNYRRLPLIIEAPGEATYLLVRIRLRRWLPMPPLCSTRLESRARTSTECRWEE